MPLVSLTTESELHDEMKKAGKKLVVVEFWASWCGPCRMMSPYFVKCSNEPEFKDVTFVQVDVDLGAELGEVYGVECMPTFIFLKGGDEVDKLFGANKEKFHSMLVLHK